MIIIKAMGGLGNQLQQYALYKKFESIGKDVRLDVSWFKDPKTQADVLAGRQLELNRFDGVSYNEASPEDIKAVLGRGLNERERLASKLKRKLVPSADPIFEEKDMYHEEIFGFTDKYLTGYWACEKYYADILPALIKEISFPKQTGENAIKNEEMIQRMEETESVSVHIRRGDYLSAANKAIFGAISTKEYYEAAINYIKERRPEAKFYFFSDDITHTKEQYNDNSYEVIDWNKGQDSFYDMMLMSHCKHNIAANSTFSFWGARFNAYPDKIMIRPSIHKNTQVCVPKQMQELWKGWVLITPQGKVAVGGED